VSGYLGRLMVRDTIFWIPIAALQSLPGDTKQQRCQMDYLVKGRDSEAGPVLRLQLLGSPVTSRVMLLQGSMTGVAGFNDREG
jgi:hypothetical protein